MAKRFTDTEIWSEDWYLYLSNEYKLLWSFALSKCNHAGIWKPNKVLFTSTCGQVDLKKAVEYFNNGKVRIIVLESGNWFFPGFFSFQYGTSFNENSKVHLSILKIYQSEGISLENCYSIDKQTFKDLTSKRPQKEVNDSVKDKEKEKDIILKEEFKAKKIDFKIPEIEDIKKYFIEKKSNEFEAEKYFNFYQSKGWLVGKNKMKDWRAAANGWISRNKQDFSKLEIQVKSKQEQQSDRIKNVAQNLIKSLKDNQNADLRPMEIAQVHG